jgi:hypothetical protein
MQVNMNKFFFTKLFIVTCLLLGQSIFVLLTLLDVSILNGRDIFYLASYIVCGVLSFLAIYLNVRHKDSKVNVMWLTCIAAILVSAVDVGGQMSNEIHVMSGNPLFSFFDVRYKSSIIFFQTGRVALGVAIFYQAFGQLVLATCLLITLLLERALKK